MRGFSTVQRHTVESTLTLCPATTPLWKHQLSTRKQISPDTKSASAAWHPQKPRDAFLLLVSRQRVVLHYSRMNDLRWLRTSGLVDWWRSYFLPYPISGLTASECNIHNDYLIWGDGNSEICFNQRGKC